MTGTLRGLFCAAALLELVAIGTGAGSLSQVAGCMWLLALLLGLRYVQRYARGLLLVGMGALLLLLAEGAPAPEVRRRALEEAAFYATFLASLGLMQCLVRRFEVLRRIHDVLMAGRCSWLYPKYALVSCGVASVLNFGMMSLLCGSLSETLRERGIAGADRLEWMRGILISALRGFALVPLVAPTSVAVAILGRTMPELSWSRLLPYGAAVALLMVLVGWCLEAGRFRRMSATRTALTAWPEGTRWLILLISAVVTGMIALVALAGMRVSVAAMMVVPLVTVISLFGFERKLGPVVAECATQMSSMVSEIAVFVGSALLGVAVGAVVPDDLLAGLDVRATGSYWLALGGMAVLPLMAMLGIIPIAVISIQAGLLPPLLAQGLDPLVAGVALVTGFSLAMMVSPFGPSVMLLSRFGQVSRWVVVFGWNGRFVVVTVPLLLALLALLVGSRAS